MSSLEAKSGVSRIVGAYEMTGLSANHLEEDEAGVNGPVTFD